MDLGSGFTPSSFTCLRTATHKYNDHCELCIRHIDEETLESFICWFVTKIRAWKHDLCIIHLVTFTHCTTLHQTEGMEVVVLSVQPVRRNNKTALKRMPQSRTAPAQNCGHHHARSRVKLHFHRISPSQSHLVQFYRRWSKYQTQSYHHHGYLDPLELSFPPIFKVPIPQIFHLSKSTKALPSAGCSTYT
jgi:hypothetical protein